MKRKKYLKKAAAGISAFVIGASAAAPAVPVLAAENGMIELNPATRYQT